jgi:hypothetical protein
MKWVARLIVIVVLASAIAVTRSAPAAACSCVQLNDAEAMSAADVVFVGQLLGSEVAPGAEYSTLDPEWFTLRVERVFKGTAFASQTVVSAREGASCGLELRSPATVLMFARLNRGGFAGVEPEALTASLCGGSRISTVDAAVALFGEGAPPADGASASGSLATTAFESPAPTSPAVPSEKSSAVWVVTVIGLTGVVTLGWWLTKRRRSAYAHE